MLNVNVYCVYVTFYSVNEPFCLFLFDVGQEMRLLGVVGTLDGMNVIKIPAKRLPTGFGFMIAHPVATVAPVKLESYKVHNDPPGISGDLVEGRIVYDAFVLENKTKAIYYQAHTSSTE